MKTNLINFKNSSLDCYSKSIDDFIKFLRNDILDQIGKCKTNEGYVINNMSFLSDLESKIQKDEFIISYFNNNRDESVLEERSNIIKKIIDLEGFSGNFIDSILKNNFINFYLKDFLNKDDFVSNSKNNDSVNGKTNKLGTYFDEVITYNKLNIKIYVEYKIKKDYGYICLYIPNKILKIDNNKIFKNLQEYTKFVVKNINNNDIIDFYEKDYFYIKIPRNNSKEKIDYLKEEKLMSENIIKYLNDELITQIILDKGFNKFLEKFIPNNSF